LSKTVAVAQTAVPESEEAGTALGRQLAAEMDQQSPDALIVFASRAHDYPKLLRAIDATCRPERLIGCSSAAEFTSGGLGVGEVCAVATRSPEFVFSAGLGTDIRQNRDRAATQLVSSFRGVESHDGAIAVESQPDRGSTFTVRLPRIPPEASTIESSTHSSRSTEL
jgi:hypothetical protein